MPPGCNVIDYYLYRCDTRTLSTTGRNVYNDVRDPHPRNLLEEGYSVVGVRGTIGLPLVRGHLSRRPEAVPELLRVHLSLKQTNSHDSGFGCDTKHFPRLVYEEPERRPRCAAV